MKNRVRELAVCVCGCGLVWERGGRGQKIRRYAPQCPTRIAESQVTPVPCGCGKCGRTFIPRYKRQFADGCPVRAEQEAAAKAERYAAYRDKMAAERVKAGLPPPKKGHGPAKGKWCTTCEGMPHRRPLGGCTCGLPHAPEQIPRRSVLASSAGTVLR